MGRVVASRDIDSDGQTGEQHKRKVRQALALIATSAPYLAITSFRPQTCIDGTVIFAENPPAKPATLLHIANP